MKLVHPTIVRHLNTNISVMSPEKGSVLPESARWKNGFLIIHEEENIVLLIALIHTPEGEISCFAGYWLDVMAFIVRSESLRNHLNAVTSVIHWIYRSSHAQSST